MAIRPAVEGLLKHQLMLKQAAIESSVMTFWTYRNEYPVPLARVDSERAGIEAWLTGNWRQITGAQVVAQRIKTWDFGVAPPAKYSDKLVWPEIPGTFGSQSHWQMCAVVALRSEPVGSVIRNRLNGRLYHPVSSSHLNLTASANVSDPTAIAAAYNNLIGRLNPLAAGDRGTMVVPSFFHAGAVRAVPVLITVNHAICRPLVGTQRRRLPKATAYARGA